MHGWVGGCPNSHLMQDQPIQKVPCRINRSRTQQSGTMAAKQLILVRLYEPLSVSNRVSLGIVCAWVGWHTDGRCPRSALGLCTAMPHRAMRKHAPATYPGHLAPTYPKP